MYYFDHVEMIYKNVFCREVLEGKVSVGLVSGFGVIIQSVGDPAIYNSVAFNFAGL